MSLKKSEEFKHLELELNTLIYDVGDANTARETGNLTSNIEYEESQRLFTFNSIQKLSEMALFNHKMVMELVYDMIDEITGDYKTKSNLITARLEMAIDRIKTLENDKEKEQ